MSPMPSWGVKETEIILHNRKFNTWPLSRKIWMKKNIPRRNERDDPPANYNLQINIVIVNTMEHI